MQISTFTILHWHTNTLWEINFLTLSNRAMINKSTLKFDLLSSPTNIEEFDNVSILYYLLNKSMHVMH